MRRRIGMIIIGTEEVISWIILLLVITTITIIIVVMAGVLFAVLTGFISVHTAIKCSMLVGVILTCVILNALISHCRSCSDDNCGAI